MNSEIIINIICWSMIIFSTFMIYCSVSCLIKIKKSLWRKALLFVGCYLLFSMIIFTGDLANLPPTMLVFLLCICIACDGSGLKRVTIGLMIASTVFAFNGLYDNCISYYIYINNLSEPIGPEGRTLFSILLYLVIRSHKPERDFELSPSLWKLLLTLSMPPLGIVFSLVLFSSPHTRRAATVLSDTALFLVAIFAFAGLIRALKVLDRQQKLERENVLAEHNLKYYEAMEQQQFEIRRMKHDLANHLQVLRALPEDEKNSYIDGMIENPAFAKILTYCGDATVNAVLTAKEGMMSQRGIEFYAKVDISEELPFEKTDICALFANALDNAAEGCRDLKPEKRRVELNAKLGKGLLAVSVKNPYEGERKETEGRLLKTTKADAVNHGFGLRSIQEAVKKYGGNMEISRESGCFTLFLYLPVSCTDKTQQ